MIYANINTPAEISTTNEPFVSETKNIGLGEHLITTRNILIETKLMLELFKRELIGTPDKPSDPPAEPQSIRGEIELIRHLTYDIRAEIENIRNEFRGEFI